MTDISRLSRLKDPFHESEVKWRIQQVGKKQGGELWAICIAFITRTAVLDRLDEVVGPENWQNKFVPGPHGGVMCGISILCGNNWITKWDGTDIQEVEPVKGTLSDAVKRAGVQWGIGRYLYRLEGCFANIHPHGKYRQPGKPGQYDPFRWDPPPLPKWALPSERRESQPQVDFSSTALSTFKHWGIGRATLEHYLGASTSPPSPPVDASRWGSKEFRILREIARNVLKKPEPSRASFCREIFAVSESETKLIR